MVVDTPPRVAQYGQLGLGYMQLFPLFLQPSLRRAAPIRTALLAITQGGGDVSARTARGPNGTEWIVLTKGDTLQTRPFRHDAVEECLLCLSGGDRILVGGDLVSPEECEPQEWRGTALSGAQEYVVQQGDLLWIPAGTPHQHTYLTGTSLILVKVPTDCEPSFVRMHIGAQRRSVTLLKGFIPNLGCKVSA